MHIGSTALADYLTQFSCTLDVGSAENAARAIEILDEMAAQLDRDEGLNVGFEVEPVPSETSPGELWIHGDDFGDVEHVVFFVLRCAEAFDLAGLWGFCWGMTWTKPQLDGFGGGAQIIDLGNRQLLEWLNCEHWFADRLHPPAGRGSSVACGVVAEGAAS